MVFLIMVVIFSASSALACGSGAEPEVFASSTDFYSPVSQDKAILTCERGGEFFDTVFKEYAIYRCIGSPTRAYLAYGTELEVPVKSVETTDEGLQFKVLNQERTILCKFRDLTNKEQEQVRIRKEKREAEKKAAEERRKAARIALIEKNKEFWNLVPQHELDMAMEAITREANIKLINGWKLEKVEKNNFQRIYQELDEIDFAGGNFQLRFVLQIKHAESGASSTVYGRVGFYEGNIDFVQITRDSI